MRAMLPYYFTDWGRDVNIRYGYTLLHFVHPNDDVFHINLYFAMQFSLFKSAFSCILGLMSSQAA